MAVDYRTMLKEEKDNVNMAAIGLHGGVYTDLTPYDIRTLEDQCIRFAIAEAKLDNLARSEDQLVVRDILPDKDFLDGATTPNAITKREWTQPWTGNYNNTETDVMIYQTNDTVFNNQKIYVFWGIKATKTGPARSSGFLNIASIKWQRGTNIKLIDIWQVEGLDAAVHQSAFAKTPLLFKKSDNFSIWHYPKTGSSGLSDNLIYLGKIVEPLGNQVSG